MFLASGSIPPSALSNSHIVDLVQQATFGQGPRVAKFRTAAVIWLARSRSDQIMNIDIVDAPSMFDCITVHSAPEVHFPSFPGCSLSTWFALGNQSNLKRKTAQHPEDRGKTRFWATSLVRRPDFNSFPFLFFDGLP